MAQDRWDSNEQARLFSDQIKIDPAWRAYLPLGSKILTAAGHGSGYWAQTARIDVQLEDGDEQAFFLKLGTRLDMVQGEYESMRALYQFSPNMVPRPIASGTCELQPALHFFLSEFLELIDEVPNVVEFCRDLASIHRKSIEMSNGRFGFDIITCNGTITQRNEWTFSWETFFKRALVDEFQMEKKVHGPSDEIDKMLPDILDKVCPRLLRPLETEGRELKPCLVHGDVWDGNIAVHADTGKAYLYDSAAFWGHNEFDMHMWRAERYRLRRAFVKEYFRHFPISPPEDDWDDRNLLYSMRADLHSSILFPANNNFRNLLIASMAALIEKFPDGYTGSAHCKDENVYPNRSSQPKNPQQVLSLEENGHGDPVGAMFYRAPSTIVAPSIDSLLHNAIDTPRETDTDIRVGESALSPYAGSIASGY